MKKQVLAVAILLSASTVALADGNITGKVTNNATGDPIDFASVQLIDASTGKALAIGTETDSEGNFILKNVKPGNYLVKVSNLGSVPQERVVTIADADVALGEIHLADDVKMLQEVVVEGVKGQMHFELDRRVFNVDSNLITAGQSASELLESIPSVEVDQDGEVSLRGSTSVTIWINGKASGLSADNRAQILEQIPGETIERIEVITNPSAKYSPEGTNGIINIILKRDRRGGYFGAAEIGANSRGGGNANLSFNYSDPKWDAYASVGFRMRHNTRGDSNDRLYDNGDWMRSLSDGRNHGNNIFLRLGGTYHLTANDEFTLSGFGMFGRRWGRTTSTYDQSVPGSWITDLHYSRNHSKNHGYHGEFSYLHRFSDNHTIEALVGYNNWGGPMWSSYSQNRKYEDSEKDELIYQEQNQDIRTSNWEAKVDYTNKLTSWLKLEAGYNGNYSHENSPVTTFSGTSKADMALDPLLYNRFIYNNNVSALYFTLGGNVDKFSFSAGLRGEAWQIRSRSLAYGETEADVPELKRNKFSLFPSAFLSYQLPYDNEVQINYTRRIRRPWGGQLNSFRNISDPTNISYGNPDLEPQYSNAFELNYIKSWTYHMISVSGYLRTSDNVMNRISYMIGNTMYTTTANVGDEVNSGVEIIVKNNLFRNVLDLTTTANLYNRHVKAWNIDFDHEGTLVPVSGQKRNSFSWDIRVMAQVRLPWGISLQANGGYNSRQINAQGSREPGWSVDAGLRKSLGNWSFTLNCRDIFNSRKWHSFTNGDGYTQESKHWHGGRTLRLTVKYSFGNMKQKRSKLNKSSEPVDGSGYGDSEM